MIIKRTVFISSILLAVILCGSFSSGAQNALSLNKEGWNFYNRTEYDRALYSFLTSIRMNPRYTDSLLGAGKTYYQLGIHDRALEMFLNVLKLDANSVDALNGVGMVLSDTGRFSEAISYFEKAYSVSGSSIESQYGLAYVYYRMDKKVWAKRKLENIFRSNPYHFESLLLMADIKTEERRLKDARAYIEKAIDSNSQSPVGYARYGRILFKNYIIENDADSLVDARESYAKALAIAPDNYNANFDMGLIELYELDNIMYENALSGSPDGNSVQQKTGPAIDYISRAIRINKNRNALYSYSLAHEMAGDKTGSLETMLDIYSKNPSDAVLREKIEDFLVLNEYKSAYPARVMLSSENIELSQAAKRETLHSMVIYYLRRALLMNPLNSDVREQLINYYSILDYNSIMIDEMKSLLRQYPGFKYQDMLNLAIMKRRDRLYYREGYSNDEVPRDVPSVLVMNLDTAGKISAHPDAGKIMARGITFAMRQYGRMKTADLFERESAAGALKTNGDNLFRSIKSVREFYEKDNRKIDFIIIGEISEVDDYLNITCRVMDLNRDFIIGEFTDSRKGKENLAKLAINTAEKLYGIIPYSGHVLKIKETGILVNLGLFDGIQAGSQLVIFRDSRSRATNDSMRYAELLTVKESDTFICYAEPDRPDLINEIDSTFSVYPLQNRRARRIE